MLEAKDPDEQATYSIDWLEELVGSAKRDHAFTSGAIVRPQLSTGFFYECTTAGRTKRHYPVWPRSAGETVSDGSVVWTTRHPDSTSATTVSSAAWTVPTGLTLVSQSEVGFVTNITLSGGEDGEDYEVLCRMTPTTGAVTEKTITIPVRSQ